MLNRQKSPMIWRFSFSRKRPSGSTARCWKERELSKLCLYIGGQQGVLRFPHLRCPWRWLFFSVGQPIMQPEGNWATLQLSFEEITSRSAEFTQKTSLQRLDQKRPSVRNNEHYRGRVCSTDWRRKKMLIISFKRWNQADISSSTWRRNRNLLH